MTPIQSISPNLVKRAPLLLLLLTSSLLAPAQTHKPPARHIAITVDDLPAMNATELDAASITEMNRKIIAALTAAKAPATGFVIEERLYKTGEVDRRIAALDSWLAAGLDLGNHTYSHTSLNQVELKDWEDDIVQGESVTRMLIHQHPGHNLRYFRHPYLDVGPDLNTRRASEAFLTGRGYRIAPVTVDPEDWFFADLYDDAHTRHDQPLQTRLAAAFLAYADESLTDVEHRSREVVGYEPRQVLLLHDTWLEADHLPDLLAICRRHGYTFTTLDDALTDPAYAQPDTYISDTGADWVEHWAVSRGKPTAPSSDPNAGIPTWVQDLHQAYDKAHPND